MKRKVKSKRSLLAIFLLILVLALTGIFLWYQWGKSPFIKRVQFEGMPDNPVFFKVKDKLLTARGVIVSNAFRERLIVSPGLNGEYLMSFSVLGAEGRIDGYVLHRQKKYGFKTAGPISMIEIPLKLSFSDRVEIFLNGVRDKILLTSPSFYKMDIRNEIGKLIFLIVADTLRRDALGVYNSKMKTSPNIDAFARDSVVFTKAFTSAPWTLPAHVSLFSGLYAYRHGVNYENRRISQETVLLSDLLKERFLLYGYTGDLFVSRRYGFSRGFDFYLESEKGYKVRKAARQLFKLVRKQLEEQSPLLNRLFFLHTYQIHNVYMPEIPLAKEYYRKIGYDNFNEFSFDILKFALGGKGIFRPTTMEKRDEIKRIYEAGVYTFDYYFGKFIRYLKRKGLYKKSMIILVADHGEELGDHKGWEHCHTLYNELINIPLIVKFPGNKFAGLRNNSLVSIVDIFPTILQQYDINSEPDYSIDGISLVNLLENSSHKERTIISYLAPYSMRKGVPMKIAVISNKLKFILQQKMTKRDLNYFIYPPPEIRKFELYDLETDPGDTANLVNQWKYRNEVKKFRKILWSIYFRESENFVLSPLFKKELESLGYVN